MTLKINEGHRHDTLR